MAVEKISPVLQTQMNTLANQEPIPVIVRRKSSFFTARVATRAAGAAYEQSTFRLIPAEVLKATSAHIETLSQDENVEYVWPDLPVYICFDTSASKINTPQVWAAGLKGQGIKVAVIDTGIDDTHPDFAGRIAATKSFVGNSARDDNGHGTHVAGIIAGSGAKSGGKYVGIAPKASLYVAKAMRANGSGSMSLVMAGIEWAVLEQQVQVINLSLGGRNSGDGADALSTMCDEAVLQAGVVICVAAGNEGPEEKTIGSPGCARRVLTVGATNDNNQVARFSSRGPTADGRTKPDIVFPGVGIIAPQAAGTRLGTVSEEGYVASDGTSMATPHASGVAALMIEANPALNAEQIKTAMMAAAVNIGVLPIEQGVGRGDAYRAYQKAIGAELPSSGPEPKPQPQPEPPGCLARIFGR